MDSKPQLHRLDAIHEKPYLKPRQNSDCVVIYTVILLTRYGSASILVYTGGMTLR